MNFSLFFFLSLSEIQPSSILLLCDLKKRHTQNTRIYIEISIKIMMNTKECEFVFERNENLFVACDPFRWAFSLRLIQFSQMKTHFLITHNGIVVTVCKYVVVPCRVRVLSNGQSGSNRLCKIKTSGCVARCFVYKLNICIWIQFMYIKAYRCTKRTLAHFLCACLCDLYIVTYTDREPRDRERNPQREYIMMDTCGNQPCVYIKSYAARLSTTIYCNVLCPVMCRHT